MIQEDYVSFELAKLLKEKGFNAMCEHYFSEKLDGSISCHTAVGHWNAIMNFIARPSLSLAIKWLREKHKIYADPIQQGNYNDNSIYYTYIVAQIIDGRSYIYRPMSVADKFTHEEAAEAAIKYSLENLI